MATKKGKKEAPLNYAAEIRRLKEEGPARLYLLWGEEDYLRDSYLGEIRKLCFPEGDDSFQHRVIRGAQPDVHELRDAMDTLPFFSERSLIEIREVDFSKNQDDLIPLVEDIPDYCTLVFLLDREEEPNGRSRLTKLIREKGRDICFTVQDQNMLIKWIVRRFAFYGKSVEMEAATRLIYLSGTQMKGLIPEIEKTAAYAAGEKVTVADVNAVANRIPEAGIFDLTDAMAERRFQHAAGILADLMAQRDSGVPAILSMLSVQFRRLLLAQQAENSRELMSLSGLKYEFMARRLMASSRNFRREGLQRALLLCAGADYRLKTEAVDEKQLLRETVMRIMLEN